MMHLTEESLRRLVQGTADPAEARALAAHLEEDCERCEALLTAAHPGPLDGHADRALTAVAPARDDESGNDLEFARIMRTVRPRRAVTPRRAFAFAAAAGLLLAAGAGVRLATHRPDQVSWDGVKGTARPSPAAPVRLSAVAVAADGQSAPRMWRIANGDVVPARSALQLAVEVGAPAEVAVARLGPDGAVDVFWSARAGAAGPVPMTVDGRPAAYSLAGLAGPQRFLAIASAEPLTADRVASLARALAPRHDPGPAPAPALDHLSLQAIEITVR